MTDRQLAAFDFDGTITRRDTLFGFLRHTFGNLAVSRALARCAPVAGRARISGTGSDVHPRDAGKLTLLHALARGHSAEAVAQAGREYARTLPPRFRPDVAGRLAWHIDQGHDVVIVSASLRSYLDPLQDHLGAADVLACEFESDTDGLLTGRLVRPNVRGPEKETRLREWMSGRDRYDLVWAYGNSGGDRELLAMADRPTLVTRADIGAVPPKTTIDRR